MKEKLFAIYDNMEDYFGDIAYRTEPGIKLLQGISTELECDLKEARQLFDYLIPFESVEALIEDEENEMLFSDDGVESERIISWVENSLDAKGLYEKLKTLTPREETVVRMRYGIGFDHEYTLEEVGKELFITRERVRQIEAKAFRKIRRRYGIKDN